MRPENPQEEEAGKYQSGRLVKSGLVEAVAESIEINLDDAGRIGDVIFDRHRAGSAER